MELSVLIINRNDLLEESFYKLHNQIGLLDFRNFIFKKFAYYDIILFNDEEYNMLKVMKNTNPIINLKVDIT